MQPETNADRLLIQAARLESHADALSREASGLRREAMELRLDAGRLERAPLRVVQADVRPRRPHSYGEAVREAARQLEVFQVSALRAQLPNLATGTVYRWVKELANAGVLEREGRHGYRYIAADALQPDRQGEATLRVMTAGTPERELEDRAVAWTTEAPA